MTRGWPFPADTAVQRARAVAHQYRNALHAVDPAACTVIDQAATLAGEDWVLPQAHLWADEDLITAPEAAALTARSVRWVYTWVAADPTHRAHGPGQIRVRVADIRNAAHHPP